MASRTDLRRTDRGSARRRILDAAVDVVRRRGLAATSVDDLCAAAGVTKGAFFHHFAAKEDLAVALADHWSQTTGEFFAQAPFHRLPTAAERVLGYLDLRAAIVSGEPAAYTCVAGTMVQETHETSPAVRQACAASILGHAATLEADIDAALRAAGRDHVDPAALARHTQAVLQGSFILAKATGEAAMVTDGIAHLRAYLTSLFTPEKGHRHD